MDAFRTRKETIKATYTAAEAQTRINEAFSGISEEMGDVGMAIQRAKDKTAQMQARAGAIDELMASGALDDAVGGSRRDDIQSELDMMAASSDVERELSAQGRRPRKSSIAVNFWRRCSSAILSRMTRRVINFLTRENPSPIHCGRRVRI